jgi:mycofactocin biosynthesis protein MftB
VAARAGTAPSAETAPGFDLDRPLALDGRVALRPEPFGALAYHFGTRRLSFIKTRKLLAVVESLGEHRSGRAACVAAGVTDDELPAYAQALATLQASGMIGERGAT